MILADTDILIDISRRYQPSVDAIDRLRGSGALFVSVVTQMELTVGCRNAREKRAMAEILGIFRIVQISESESQLAAALIDKYFLSHGLLMPDALIAATAVTHGYSLLTRNRRHFGFVPGLQLTAVQEQ